MKTKQPSKSIGILGGGKIGTTLAHMLRHDLITVRGIRQVVVGDIAHEVDVEIDATDPANLEDFVSKHDAIISALPFALNKSVAETCRAMEKSYFDFTEDTDTTRHIQELAKDSKATFMPQCGLAPGAINIVAASLIESFNGPVQNAELRVGALPLTTTNEMKYYLSWSTAGLVNEYIQPCDALHLGVPVKLLPLDGLETVILDGVEYEAFNTSGGVATMCETYAGKVKSLNYKTMRYPGHCEHMRFVIRDLNLQARPELLEQIMDHGVPLTESDVVIIYCNVIGEHDGRLVQRSFVHKVLPKTVVPHNYSAIQIATAGSMAGLIELWANGYIGPGFVRQESIKLEDFVATRWGRMVLGE